MLELSDCLEWSKVGTLKDLKESEMLLARTLLLGLENIRFVSLKDVPELELGKLEC